jgi:SAM-dependent methyltransferase
LAAEELDRFDAAYGPAFKFHDENLAMLSWYAERMMKALAGARAESLVSLGIGHSVVTRRVLAALGRTLKRYTIVEGSPARIRALRAQGPLPDGVTLENAFFEDFAPSGPLDAVEMGFVLEHVEDPALVLRRFAGFLRPNGTLIAVVPNARSLHRVVGHRAGLLDDPFRLSEHDRALGHRRYFDLESIKALIAGAGLQIRSVEGIFLKCLTTSQLAGLALPPPVLRAFFEVGVDYPEIANAIYLETTA